MNTRTIALVFLIALSTQQPLFAGGGGTDYNADTIVSMPFDPARSMDLPALTISSRLFPLPPRNYYTYNGSSELLTKLNAIAEQHKRQILFTYNATNNAAGPEKTPTILPSASRNFSLTPDWGDCRNAAAATFEFIEALAADPNLSTSDFAELSTLRVTQLFACHGAADWPEIASPTSTQTAYKQYLVGVDHFYRHRYPEALQQFELVSQSIDPSESATHWLAETSRYMLGRLQLLIAQANWFPFSRQPGSLDSERLNQAITAFNHYINDYPNGLYYQSALGLKRRVLHLQGDTETYRVLLKQALSNVIAAMNEHYPDNEILAKQLHDLIIEYQRYSGYSGTEILTELLAALKQQPGNSKLQLASNDLEILLEQVNQFADKTLPAPNWQPSSLLEIKVGLYARYWQQQGDHKRAIELLETQRNAFRYSSDPDLLIAENLYQADGLMAVLAYQDYKTPFIKQAYLNDTCHWNQLENFAEASPQTQQQQLKDADDHGLILQTLLARYLREGDFDRMHSLFRRYPDKLLGQFAQIRTAAEQISRQTKPGKAYMNIGYWLGKNPSFQFGLRSTDKRLLNHKCDPQKQALSTRYNAISTLGAYDYFLKALAAQQNQDDQAKTLHFLVMCSRPGWRGLDCYSSSRRLRKPSKHWFDLLHARFPKSKWARKTPYYYNDYF